MNKDKLFLATINGELVGVMTMADAIKYAWNMDHATLSLEPEPEQKPAKTETEDKKIQTVPSIKVEEDYSVTVVNKASLLSFFKDGANLDGLYNVVQAKARALVADVTTAAVTAEKGALEVMLNAALKKEAEARELEELRRKQEEAERIIREQKIREEAERKARAEAEARAAAEKARLEREKAEAERKAAEAERAAKEAMEREAEARKTQATASVDFPVFQGAAATANNGAQTATPVKRPSMWTDEQKKVNSAILARFAEIIRASLPKHIAGHSDQGYELAANEAAKEIINAIACGKIENIKVEY